MATIDRLEIEIQSSAENASAALDRLVDQLRQVSNTMRGINGNGLNNMATGVQHLGTNMRRVAWGNFTGGMRNYNIFAKSARKQTLNLATAFGKLYIKLVALREGVRYLGKSIKGAMDYVETLNYFNQAFVQVTENADLSNWKDLGYESAQAYIDSFSERAKELTQKLTGFEVSNTGELTRTSMPSLGLDPEKTLQYQATFAQMSSSMGVASETALKLSDALTMIGADLASVRNLDFNNVWQDMTSGLVGMSRTWDKYGVNIRNVNLQQKLNELGINASIAALNQQDKAILRTIILLDSTRYAWGDLATTINQPANQLRLLESNFQSLARTIGSLFIPVITRVLPYINALLIAVQRLFSWIAGLFGINLSSFTNSVGSAAADMGGIADEAKGTADGLGSAAKAADKLKKSLRAYDELNVVPEKTDSGGAGGSGIDGVGDMSALNAALDEILNEYQKAWNDAFAEMENNANEIADRIVDAFHKIRIAAIPTTASIIKLREEGLDKLGDFTWGTLKDFWENFLKPIGFWALSDQSGLPRFFKITNDILNGIDWNRLKNSLSDFYSALVPLTQFAWTALMDFYEYFLKPVAVWTMGEGLPQFIDTMTKFINTVHWDEINISLANFWKALSPFATSVGQGLLDFFKDLLGIGANFINTVVPKGFDDLAGALKKIKPETAEKIGYALGIIATSLVGFKIIGSIVGGITALGTKLGALTGGLSVIGSVFGTIGGLVNSFAGMFMSGGVFYEAIGMAGVNLSILIEGIMGIAVPIEASVAAILVFIGALIDLWNTSETFRGSIVRVFENVKDSLTNAFNKIIEAVKPFLKSVKDLASSIYDFYESSGIKSVVALFATLAVTIGGSVLSTAIDVLSTAFAGLIKVLSGAAEIISGVLDVLTGIFTLDFDKAVSGFEKIAGGILLAFSGLIEGTAGIGKDIVEGLFKGIKDAISSVGSWLKEHVVEPMVSNVKKLFGIHSPSTVFAEIGENLIKGLQEGIVNIWGSFISVFSDLLGNIFDLTTETWSNIYSSVSEKVKVISEYIYDTWEDIKSTTLEKWSNIKEFISSNVTEIKDSIYNKLTDAKNNVADIFGNIKSSIEDKINGARDAVKNAIDKIKSFFDFTWSLPKLKLPHIKIKGDFSLYPPSAPSFGIDWYANGGVFDTPSVIGVGERGAEAVMPLEHNTGWIDTLAAKIDSKSAMSENTDILLERILVELERLNDNPVEVSIDGRNVFKAVRKEAQIYKKQTGQAGFSF